MRAGGLGLHFPGRMLGLGLCLGMLTSLLGCTNARPPPEAWSAYVDDAAITTAVKVQLLQEAQPWAQHITVQTLNGTVMLSGQAQSPQDKAQVEAIARNTPQVRDVWSRIAVSEGD